MKRPLLIAAAAFVSGEILADYMKYLPAFWLAIVFFVLIKAKFVYESAFQTKDLLIKEIVITSVFLGIGGSMNSNLNEIYNACKNIENGKHMIISGEVTEIIKTSFGFKMMVTSENGESKGTKVLLCTEENPNVRIKNRIKAECEKEAFEQARNKGNFDEEIYYKGKKVFLKANVKELTVLDQEYSEIREMLSVLREKLCTNIEKSCGDRESSVLKAIIYGEKSDLDSEIKEQYSKNGIAHILAISGLHMSLVGMGIYRLLRYRFSFVNSGIVCLVVICFFGVMTGFGVSVKRALYMMIIRILGDILGRKYDLRVSISFSILLLLIENPFYLINNSFLLSYSAIISIGFVYPELEKWLEVENPLLKTILAGSVMWLVNLPLIAYMYFEVPTYAVFLNLIVIPLMSMVFLSGMATSGVMFFSMTLGVFCVGAAAFVLKFYLALCRFVERLPGAYVVTGKPDLETMVIFYAVLFFGVYLIRFLGDKKALRNGVMISTIVVLIALIYGDKSPHGLRISVIDVDQGDCILIENGNGKNYLIDGGSTSVSNVGKYRIVPYLKAMGIKKIDYVLISHSDSDHMNGICEIIENDLMNIENIGICENPLFMENYNDLKQQANEKGIKIITLTAGDLIKEDTLSFEIISPDNGNYTDVNSASMVMNMKYDEFSMCFTGDMDASTEKKVLESVLDSDILKVAHHGSKTASSKGFLQKTMPEIAVISCGVENSYGHPHMETLENLREMNAKTFITAERGCIIIQVKSGGNRYTVQHFLN